MKKVLLLTRDQKKFKKEFSDSNIKGIEFLAPEDEDEILEIISEIEIIIGIPWIIEKYLDKAKNLKWIQSIFTGIDSFVNGENPRNDYILTNVRGIYGDIISEYIFAYILGFEKDLFGNRENQIKKLWKQRFYPSVKGKKIGIMGVGSIGKSIAKIAKAFQMEVYGFATSSRTLEHFDKIYTQETIIEFVKDLDYLISTLPNTKHTDGIINKAIFENMKNSSLFVNVGRGANIIENDLIQAIKTKKIAKAVLDAFREEPLPETSLLWEEKNIYITPHISGYDIDNTEIIKIFRENYIKFESGDPLDYMVDFKKGY